jgi:hypothetical protein
VSDCSQGNPTLSVLVRVRAASALNVSIEELIGPPRAIGRFYRADQLLWSGWSSRGGDAWGGVPHTPGSREYLFCESGKVELSASGSSWQLEPGDVVVFRGDQRHSYRNLGKAESVAFSVVLLPPPGS